MIGWLIIACEISFWVFVLLGLFFRYILKLKTLGGLFLLCTPLIDLVLVGATIIDLKNGAAANFFHGLSGIYIGVTVAYGHSMIRWADERFAYRFADGDEPVKKPKYGREHAKFERRNWVKHLLAWIIGCLFLWGMILLVGDTTKTNSLLNIIYKWTFVLGIDFLWSFSYTIWPRKDKGEST
ncbi:hypothetical protein ACQKP0_04715 [Heyndrickxia sp. NPDC080065]|uniref:hypothetical protein n=1 Tax=Heyndrickxia sp. NPDC080065 TaxID=3390568 RepID=UPI003D0384B6